MTKNWIDTVGPDEADGRIGSFWAGHQTDLRVGEFWAERIKRYRAEPDKRLKSALNELPFPAAFREAAIAMRAMIRQKRKAKEPCVEHLAFLYWLAAMNSLSVPYSARLGEPGFNVMESIPGDRLRAMTWTYAQLGYLELDLLNATDRKWLVEAWGEPERHLTLNLLHRALWVEFEDRLLAKRKPRPSQRKLPEPSNLGFAGFLSRLFRR